MTVINELLCFVQNKLSNTPHDYLAKVIVDFYSEEEIDSAKHKLCTLTADVDGVRRIIKRSKVAGKGSKDAFDIFGRLNEVGKKCPCFVTRDIANLPPPTMDLFDLSKMSKYSSGSGQPAG